jgi:ZIP family zinc transporter
MNTENVLFAFALTLFAGLSTGIGSALAFFTKRTNTRFLTYSLGFSAGVMIFVSLVEIFQKSVQSFAELYSQKASYGFALLAFFGGIAFIALIDMLIPSYENPHEIRSIEEIDKAEYKIEKNKKLARMGVFSALAIAIHNFPEGIATFAAGLADPEVAIPIAFAIAIHNIPEGIAVSVPVYYATGNRRKAFLLSFLSGLAEPVGALVGFILIYFIAGGMNPVISGVMFGTVAGIMVFISLDELLPTAEEYGEHHISIYGLVSGMAIMAVSLLLFM